MTNLPCVFNPKNSQKKGCICCKRHRVFVGLRFFSLSSVIKFDKICANLTQRSQSLMLFRVLAKVKLLRVGLILGWGTAEKSP